VTPPTTDRGMNAHFDFNKVGDSSQKASNNTNRQTPNINYYKKKCEKLLLEKQKYHQNIIKQKVEMKLLKNQLNYLQSSPSPFKSSIRKDNKENHVMQYSSEKQVLFH
jgi:hypothetical protein